MEELIKKITLVSEAKAFVSIEMDRYDELLKAEQQAENLKRLIHRKAEVYENLTYAECQMLCVLFGITEERKEDENGSI